MAFKKTREQLDKEYKFAIDCARKCGKEAAKEDTFHNYITQLGYLDASLIGGKITIKEAMARAKDLYKCWKDTNKGIDKE